jgi:peptidoglycan hydrolase-like protein with peptidoglycan-binding domain
MRSIDVKRTRFALGCILCAWSAGCAQAIDSDGVTEHTSAKLSIQDVHRELAAGDRGPEVEAVYEHLRGYGYFPNPTLAERYPSWTPVVPDAPKHPQTFGPELEEAVAQAQRYLGLPATGRVDARTLTALKGTRCGMPESGVPALDPSDKWGPIITDSNGNPARWNKTAIKYKITDFGGVSQTTANAALDAALNTWNAATFLTASRTTGSTFDVEVKFWARGTPPVASAWTIGATKVDFTDVSNTGASFPPPSSMTAPFQRIGINVTLLNSGADLQSTMVHEVGHTLGFGHSTVFNGDWGIMAPSLTSGTIRRTLTQDDRQLVSLLYNVWDPKNGLALDIGAGGSAGAPKVYVISGNNTIWFYKNNNFTPIAGNGAAIAVDDQGYAWVVSSDGSIWIGSGTDPTAVGFTWINKSWFSSAYDIGASGGQVWIISRVAAVGSQGNFLVQQLTGTGCTGTGGLLCSWSSANGGAAKRIAVDWLGRPWVTQFDGTVWRFTIGTDGLNVVRQSSGNPSWHSALTQLNPPVKGKAACATDIAAGSDHSVWIVGCNASSNDFGLWIWDEQDGSTTPGGLANQEGEFRPLDGLASRISASPNGRAWVSQAAGYVFVRSPRTNTPAP